MSKLVSHNLLASSRLVPEYGVFLSQWRGVSQVNLAKKVSLDLSFLRWAFTHPNGILRMAMDASTRLL